MMRIPHRTPSRLARQLLVAALLPVALVACGDDERAVPAAANVPGSVDQIERRIGDTTVNVYATQGASLAPEVAAAHGIPRDDDVVLLMISPRRGDMGNITAVPLTVEASMMELQGTPTPIQLKEVVTNGLLDYVGVAEITVPDTVRFVVNLRTPTGETETLSFDREFQALDP